VFAGLLGFIDFIRSLYTQEATPEIVPAGGAIGGGGEQPKSTKVTKQVLLFLKFILSFCKGGCISTPCLLEGTSSHCWGCWDQPSVEIKAKDCKAAGGVEGELQWGEGSGGTL